jgi:hypothetical protein
MYLKIKQMKRIILIIFTILALSVFGIIIVKSISLKQNCTGYLKRAADANTIEIARVELAKAISYLEENNLTSGYTSVLYKTPDEDIEFWYNNLKSSQNELLKVTENTSSLEKSNLLMKLRETLIDNGKDGETLTVPNGLSRYPNNLLWGLLMWTSLIFLIGIFIRMITKHDLSLGSILYSIYSRLKGLISFKSKRK